MLLYADEDFPGPAVEELRLLGHDVLTAQDDGRRQTPDLDILARAHFARAHFLGRAVITYNRRHYERLHRQGIDHSGILSATKDDDFPALAARVHAALVTRTPSRWCIRVNRPCQSSLEALTWKAAILESARRSRSQRFGRPCPSRILTNAATPNVRQLVYIRLLDTVSIRRFSWARVRST
jgi:hypothetical protein